MLDSSSTRTRLRRRSRGPSTRGRARRAPLLRYTPTRWSRPAGTTSRTRPSRPSRCRPGPIRPVSVWRTSLGHRSPGSSAGIGSTPRSDGRSGRFYGGDGGRRRRNDRVPAPQPRPARAQPTRLRLCHGCGRVVIAATEKLLHTKLKAHRRTCRLVGGRRFRSGTCDGRTGGVARATRQGEKNRPG